MVILYAQKKGVRGYWVAVGSWYKTDDVLNWQ